MREKQVLVTGSVAKDPQRSICHDLRDVDKPINSSYFTMLQFLNSNALNEQKEKNQIKSNLMRKYTSLREMGYKKLPAAEL